VLIAAIDVPYQLFQHIKSLKMTLQEVREEMKESDGTPEVKGKIRQLQNEVARRRMMQEVPKADVVITNPTHFAVALRYDEKRMRAPIVVAKGVDELALRIREIGEANRVMRVEAPPLARAPAGAADAAGAIGASAVTEGGRAAAGANGAVPGEVDAACGGRAPAFVEAGVAVTTATGGESARAAGASTGGAAAANAASARRAASGSSRKLITECIADTRASSSVPATAPPLILVSSCSCSDHSLRIFFASVAESVPASAIASTLASMRDAASGSKGTPPALPRVGKPGLRAD
jgi:hypothetical protein